MEFVFYMPTKVIIGKSCIKNNSKEFTTLGKNALIVTYPISRQNGSVDDVVFALTNEGIEYSIYDQTAVNPTLNDIAEIGNFARESKADFIIGIGGGSALDTAKATAVLSTNNINTEDLYSNKFENRPLPVVTIPTTAGTGSEVTPYSVLLLEKSNMKKSFGNNSMCPAVAFLDATYTLNLPYVITIDTAVDALSHAIEGYLTKKANPVSDMFDIEIMKIFAVCYESLLSGKHTFESREKLLYAAMLSGISIVHARTLAVHALGYALTVSKNVSHGRANGLLLWAYLDYVKDFCKDRIESILDALKLKSLDDLKLMIERLMKNDIKYTEEELREYTSTVFISATERPNPRDLTKESIYEIYRKSLI